MQAQEVAPNDMLLADLWTQRSVEYRGNALTVFALARIRLDQALADKSWTAAPGEQKGDYQNLPPAWCSTSTRPCWTTRSIRCGC